MVYIQLLVLVFKFKFDFIFMWKDAKVLLLLSRRSDESKNIC